MIFNIAIIVIIVLLLLFLSMIWPPDSPWAPWWRTSQRVAKAQCKLAGIKENDVIYDLGSGDGTALMIAAKEYGATGVGIEIDPLRVYIAKLLLQWYGVDDKIAIVRDSFFNQDISKASVIFVYLVPKTLKRLLPKMKKELKKGTRIVSFRYQMDLSLVKEDKEHQLRMYKI